MNELQNINNFRVLGIDPGSHHTGFAIIDIDLVSGDIVIPSIHTINRREILKSMPWMVDVYGPRQVAVLGCGNELNVLLHRWEPNAIISESPYLGRLPQAFKVLTELLTVFQTKVMEWDHTVPFETIDPASAKVFMGVKGGSKDKEEMRTALLESNLPIRYNGIDINTIDEHGIDATCVGLTKAVSILATG